MTIPIAIRHRTGLLPGADVEFAVKGQIVVPAQGQTGVRAGCAARRGPAGNGASGAHHVDAAGRGGDDPLAHRCVTRAWSNETLFRFTYTTPMDWRLPGVPPTGKRVEVAIVVVVQFRDGKLAREHIYWDQASVLVQVGLLDPGRLPLAGRESARKAADPALPVEYPDPARRAGPFIRAQAGTAVATGPGTRAGLRQRAAPRPGAAPRAARLIHAKQPVVPRGSCPSGRRCPW